jgi:hypothetical protein
MVVRLLLKLMMMLYKKKETEEDEMAYIHNIVDFSRAEKENRQYDLVFSCHTHLTFLREDLFSFRSEMPPPALPLVIATKQ